MARNMKCKLNQSLCAYGCSQPAKGCVKVPIIINAGKEIEAVTAIWPVARACVHFGDRA